MQPVTSEYLRDDQSEVSQQGYRTILNLHICSRYFLTGSERFCTAGGKPIKLTEKIITFVFLNYCKGNLTQINLFCRYTSSFCYALNGSEYLLYCNIPKYFSPVI